MLSNDLHAYSRQLNEKHFSQAMGWHWFVNRNEDGREFLDRKDVGRVYDHQRGEWVDPDKVKQFVEKPIAKPRGNGDWWDK